MNTAKNIIQYPMTVVRNESESETDGKRWVYINLEEHDEMIRNEERVRLFNERMQRYADRKVKETREIRRSKYFALQKAMGFLVIIAALLIGEPFKGLYTILTVLNILTGLVLVFSKKKLLWVNK